MRYNFITISIILLLILTTGPAHATQRIIIYGDDAYPPYSFKSNGEPDGIYVKILESIFSEMKSYIITIEMVPWKRAMLALRKGYAFAVFPPYYRPKSRPYIDKYSEPILDEGYSVFCRTEILKTPRPNWPDDYLDLQIGTNHGFCIPNCGKMNLQEAQNNEANLKKLLTKKIDCYVNNRESILYTAKKMAIEPSFIKESLKISSEYGFLAYSNRNNPPYKSNFIKEFDQRLQKMKESGEIDKIIYEFLH